MLHGWDGPLGEGSGLPCTADRHRVIPYDASLYNDVGDVYEFEPLIHAVDSAATAAGAFR